uniref:SRP54-type proteins GTP-binding domain-containing protein n=1 Tax=Aplanochytrium stocchinoi TaxID=215587 RepID=A0A7S3PLY3_9STRA
MEQVREVAEPDEVIFVMDSTAGQGVFDQASAFKQSVPVGSVVITKLDGNAKGGGALSAVAATNSPITFIGTGEHFDEFEHFDAKSFVSRLLGMGDIKGLIETFKEKTDLFEKAPEMMERLQKGVFTLRDMKQQFVSVMKMGNMSQLMSMIPGMSNMMPKGSEKDGQKRIQMFMTCMDSMTDDELDGIFKSRKYDPKDGKYKVVVEKYFNADRIRRIALGSGTSVQVVQLLLQCHKQFEKMIHKMGKNGLMKQSDAGLSQRMQRNPQALMQQLQRSMDPRMMQQMGGAQGMMEMMKQMGNMDMGELMKNMGGMPGMGGMGGGKKPRGRRR